MPAIRIGQPPRQASTSPIAVASAKQARDAKRTWPGVSKPSAVARGRPSRPARSVPRSKSLTSLSRLVPVCSSKAPSADSSISAMSMRPVSAHASAQPTSTGLTLMVSVCGREAMAHARSHLAARPGAGIPSCCVCMARAV